MIASILRTQLGDCLPESAISSGIQGGGIKTGAISRTDLKINRTQASDFFIIWVYLYHTTTQMRYLLFVVIGLIGCFPLRAQTPEDNLRDEEYYPFQNGYEEPYSPMIDTDSSLFYRAIQSTGDLFRDATDFKFSFVAYNRRGEPYRPDRMSLNGIRLPVALHSVDECLVSPKVRRADERMAFTDDSGRRIPNLRRATAPGAQCGTPILRPQLPDGAPPDHRRKPRPELGPCGDRTGPHRDGTFMPTAYSAIR